MANLTIDYLKEKEPIIEFYSHLNEAYIYFDKNKGCGRAQPQLLDITKETYPPDAPELTHDYIIDSESTQINLTDYRTTLLEEGYPKYQYKTHMENTFYKFRVKTGYFEPGDDGVNVHYSFEKVIIVNNLIPEVASFKIEKYFCGSIRDMIKRNKKINLFYNEDYSNDWRPNDIVRHLTIDLRGKKIYLFEEVTDFSMQSNGIPLYTFNRLDSETLIFITKILGDRDFEQTVKDYHGGEIPEGISSIKFILTLGQEKYLFYVRGYLLDAVRDYSPSFIPTTSYI